MDGLKATNKFLLEETANMRLAAKGGGDVGATAGGGGYPSGSGAGYPPVGGGGYPPSYSSGGAGPAGAYGQSRMGAGPTMTSTHPPAMYSMPKPGGGQW